MNQAVAQFAPLLLIMVVFYFLIMRPQQRNSKHTKRCWLL